MTTAHEAILCRYGEIFLKGENRPWFERKLLDNIRDAVAGTGARVERLHGRVLVHPGAPDAKASDAKTPDANAPTTAPPTPPAPTDAVVARLQKVFGLSSISPALLVERALPAIAEAAVRETARAIEDFAATHGRRPTFKVEARRADKRFLPASPELAREVGAAILGATGLRVDVHHPELVVGVEVGFEHAFVWARVAPGPGGLPIGASGKVDLLLSGGIDSPVAGWMAMKRGCHLAATYFHSFPYTGDRTKEKVAGLARMLAGWQGALELRVVPFTAAQKALRDAGMGDARYAVVLYRRMMMRVATRLAEKRGALALVTGEALGQVASQTLENLACIQEAAGLPVLRPLVAHDKVETIAWARRIGTYELSIEPYEDACSMFVPAHPEIHAKLDRCHALEARVDVPGLVEECVAGVERIVCERPRDR